ncbi:hypothetical protein D7I47_13355 [Protaetiibacter intestinalis]|uniref:Uncharacterized protein n=1 Tax=Protaetiibacter intestinalis TaxID=2419774 RepID=A0A387B9W3_9MICO|nr:hypothetical protein D7I47_13355 [Protaetiibacter intestinalis]
MTGYQQPEASLGLPEGMSLVDWASARASAEDDVQQLGRLFKRLDELLAPGGAPVAKLGRENASRWISSTTSTMWAVRQIADRHSGPALAAQVANTRP